MTPTQAQFQNQAGATSADPQAISLDQLPSGARATVQRLLAGRSLASRLVSLGITPGVELDMVQNYGHGPLIVAVRGTRVAIGRGEAAKILVQRG